MSKTEKQKMLAGELYRPDTELAIEQAATKDWIARYNAAMTLPVGISARVTQYEIKWGAMSAAGVVAMVPVLIFSGIMQRYLVRGLSLGAVKG